MNTETPAFEERIRQLEKELKKTTDTLNNYKKEQEEFILIASHDLQAPLRKLSTFVERLTNKFTDLPEEAKTYSERIQAAVTNMRSLIDGLGSLSEVAEAGKNFQKCDLNEVLQKVLNVQPEYKARITCSTLPVIEGNCTQLQHLFQNLIDNAIKFKKKDSPLQIVVDAKEINNEEKKSFNLAAHRKYHKIEIADNGIGFEDQYSEKIFQPFQRLHGKAEYEGNGLGLAICKKIAEKHNGMIYAKGNTDSGARFTVILPETSN